MDLNRDNSSWMKSSKRKSLSDSDHVSAVQIPQRMSKANRTQLSSGLDFEIFEDRQESPPQEMQEGMVFVPTSQLENQEEFQHSEKTLAKQSNIKTKRYSKILKPSNEFSFIETPQNELEAAILKLKDHNKKISIKKQPRRSTDAPIQENRQSGRSISNHLLQENTSQGQELNQTRKLKPRNSSEFKLVFRELKGSKSFEEISL